MLRSRDFFQEGGGCANLPKPFPGQMFCFETESKSDIGRGLQGGLSLYNNVTFDMNKLITELTISTVVPVILFVCLLAYVKWWTRRKTTIHLMLDLL